MRKRWLSGILWLIGLGLPWLLAGCGPTMPEAPYRGQTVLVMLPTRGGDLRDAGKAINKGLIAAEALSRMGRGKQRKGRPPSCARRTPAT